MNYTLSDNAISAIARLVQLAILTGTDVVDNLRTLQLTVDGDKLTVSEEFRKNFEANLNELAQKAMRLDERELVD